MVEVNVIASSAPANGATSINANGSRFTLNFQGKGIDIPKAAQNVQISMPHATVWNTIPNITTANNTLEIVGPDLSDVITTYTITVPQGLYDLESLDTSIKNQLINAGAQTADGPLISLQPNYSTNKVEVIFGYSNVTIDFSIANSLLVVMGFDSSVYGPFSAGHVLSAPNQAEFNSVNGVIIHTSLVSEGVRIGAEFNQAVGQVSFSVAPGSLETYAPFNVLKVYEEHLAGVRIKNIVFWITDELNNDIVMTEYWSATIRISWD
jgi:hypothetical protein